MYAVSGHAAHSEFWSGKDVPSFKHIMTCLGHLERISLKKPVHLARLVESCDGHVLERDFWEAHYEKQAAQCAGAIRFRGKEISRMQALELIHSHGITWNLPPVAAENFSESKVVQPNPIVCDDLRSESHEIGHVFRYKL